MEQDAVTAGLRRYEPLVGDWDAFAAALARPSVPCISVNRLRIAPARLEAMLREDGRAPQRIAWDGGAFRLPADARPGLWWQSQAGLYQGQEEASLLPVNLLDARPGERVLDLCAAPGGKTALIAIALGNRGTLLANDKDSRRLTAIRDKMKRLGLLNVTTTVRDGADFPLSAGPFDRVLADVPCSSEGTNFRNGASYLRTSEDFRRWIAGQQRALLRRAVALTRPGGRIVYSTCSFAPEENEAVVNAVLREAEGMLRVVPLPVEGLASSPGVVAWQGAEFHPDLRHAVRLWPHLSGTGGFFAVALERVAGAAAQPAPAAELPGEPLDGAEEIALILEHFGLPADAFAELTLLAKGDHAVAVADDHAPPPRPQPVSTGVPLFRMAGRWPKLTTSAALAFGAGATRNVVELDAAQSATYQARRPVEPAGEQLSACDGRGYVMLRHRGVALGLGLLRPGPSPVIESEFPRAWVPERQTRVFSGEVDIGSSLRKCARTKG